MNTSNALSIGDAAPELELPTQSGEIISLSGYQGQKNVVLYFYPKDSTPGCTQEAQDFRDLAKDFAKADTVIIGVSKDSLASHEKFAAKQSLNFALASDEN